MGSEMCIRDSFPAAASGMQKRGRQCLLLCNRDPIHSNHTTILDFLSELPERPGAPPPSCVSLLVCAVCVQRAASTSHLVPPSEGTFLVCGRAGHHAGRRGPYIVPLVAGVVMSCSISVDQTLLLCASHVAWDSRKGARLGVTDDTKIGDVHVAQGVELHCWFLSLKQLTVQLEQQWGVHRVIGHPVALFQ